MKIVITHLDFSAYFVDRLIAFQELCNIHGDELHIIEVLGESPLYPFLKVSKSKLSNFEYLLPKATYDNVSINLMRKKLTKRLDEINPDVIFSGPIAFPPSAISLRWAKKHNKGIVLFDDCQMDTFIRGRFNTFIKKRLYSCVDAFFCPSPAYKASMKYWGFHDEQIFYGLNAVNNEFWFNTSDTYCDDFKNCYFITIGRQVPFKNLVLFLEAYKHYRVNGGETPLLMVGNGPVHEELLELAKGDKQISFLSYQEPKELKKLYRNAKALIVPSHKTETWGLVVNEAMCAGRCVAVSTEVGSCSTLVNERNGYTFNPNSSTEMENVLFAIDKLSEVDFMKKGAASQEIISQWGLERFSNGLYDALKYVNTHHVHLSILNRILTKFWRGRLNKMERV